MNEITITYTKKGNLLNIESVFINGVLCTNVIYIDYKLSCDSQPRVIISTYSEIVGVVFECITVNQDQIYTYTCEGVLNMVYKPKHTWGDILK